MSWLEAVLWALGGFGALVVLAALGAFSWLSWLLQKVVSKERWERWTDQAAELRADASAKADHRVAQKEAEWGMVKEAIGLGEGSDEEP